MDVIPSYYSVLRNLGLSVLTVLVSCYCFACEKVDPARQNQGRHENEKKLEMKIRKKSKSVLKVMKNEINPIPLNFKDSKIYFVFRKFSSS